MKHILVLPIPLLGHIIPMLNLCCKLASRGIGRITVLINQDCVDSVKKIHEELVSSGDLSSEVVFTVESIPVTYPPAFQGSAEQVKSLLQANDNGLEPAQEVAFRVLGSDTVPQLSFLLSDFALWWSQDLANKLGIPRVVLSIIGFQEIGIILQMPWLISQGIYSPFTEATRDDSKLIELPGYPAFKPSEIPQVSQFPEASQCYWDALLRFMTRAREAKLFLSNSCYELEGEAYREIVKVHKLPLYLAGPLLASSPLESNAAGSDQSLQWLDRIESPRSVLFASFGTYLQLPPSELEEILLGIENSGVRFLLAFRSDVIAGSASPAVLSFLDRYKLSSDPETVQKGVILPWAPQPKVLKHPAIGGHFTHFGWNSVLESITGGVPMLGKPMLGDQFGNRRLAVDRWKMALEIPEDKNKKLTREAVGGTIRALFGNEELYDNAARLGEVLKNAVQENGDSYKCWDMVAAI